MILSGEFGGARVAYLATQRDLGVVLFLGVLGIVGWGVCSPVKRPDS